MGTGQNPKAVEARERKKAAADAKKLEEAKRKEDAKWVDDDKHINARLSRKAEQEAKAEEKLRKKAELKEIEQDEQSKLQSTKPGKTAAPKKLTRAEILLRQMQADQERKAQERAAKAQDDLLQPNINHMLREEHINAVLEGTEIVGASGIDAALGQLEGEAEDMHPERRRKAAYKAYEEEWIERMKLEHPGLKRSQMKERIFKQWQSAPENPVNQAQS
eukprot:Blabericola_migrator_1__950@NODE_1239_length_5016_cov_82_322287_g838_i0_p3_GENE_NODE_1239_length_5016_cov_82_322287_g838_i0NODE_1239_length_5016_cov_82_322287_g838_i0_p3_ORF_typecomplete_len219_score60_55Ccdc124/PF06244_12/2_7e24_NODE_1239_length_5016_cov_82_322287_g838_i030513707